MEDTKMNEQEETIPKKCPTCGVGQGLMAVAAAHTACESLTGQDKTDCGAWADSLKPEDVEESKKVWIDILRKTGMSGMRKATDSINVPLRAAIVEVVAEKLDRGEMVPQDEMEAYKEIINEKGV